MKRLVLFDIDGTILLSDGAGRRAMEGALSHAFGTPGNAGYHYDGKTDRQIVRELMRHDGHDDAYIDARLESVVGHYLTRLHAELGDGARVRVLPGVRALIDALDARADIILGLLTGNVEEGAAAKLRAASIDVARFRVNAYGSDHEHRPRLPEIAQRRAREALGIDLEGDAIVVIGDTPADIDCARSVSARTIAVATGRYTVDELASHGPSAVFEDLSDTPAVIAAITR